MPEILKDKNGETNWSAVFMGFAVALVLILQQVQTMHIADIKIRGEINAVNFMHKDEVLKIQTDLMTRVEYVELHTMPKDVVGRIIETINGRISELETKDHEHGKDKK